MPRLTVDLEPIGHRAEIELGESILDAAQSAGVGLLSTCGGQGSCFDCRVRLALGQLSPPTLEEQAALSQEELENGYRLACQAEPQGDVKVDIPPDSLSTPQRLSIEGQMAEVPVDPIVLPYDLELEPPTMSDLRSDASRLLAALKQPGVHISRYLLTDLSSRLRLARWRVRLALRDQEIVAILPAGSNLLGLAVDIGTTKIAAYLVNLVDGETLAKTGVMNPQIAYGEDVISRIHYANTHAGGRKVLQEKIVDALNGLISKMVSLAGVSIDQIVEAVVVGNTAMHHFFAGLPVEQLGSSPYVPAVSEPLEFPAAEINLQIAPAAYVYLPPNLAGYVGADHVAMSLATGLPQKTGKVIALDIGTNTEISLNNNGHLLSCSCASGPAFEGAHIRNGMRAAPGAIEKVNISDRVQVATIDHQPAVGLCGSGILDVVGELVKVGALDKRGKLKPGHPVVRDHNQKRDVLLVSAQESGHGREITIEREDINEIQLAKGAIRAGVEILLLQAGLRAEELDEFIVAGAFGTYLDLDSAVRVGMFPELPSDKFTQVGNAAGAGARQMLISRHVRDAALEFARNSRYIELTMHPDFQSRFIAGIMLDQVNQD